MEIYYWHSSTEKKVMVGDLNQISDELTSKFWSHLPPRYKHLDIEQDLGLKLKEVRSFSFLSTLLRSNPYDLGTIEELFNEAICTNIYVADPVWFTREEQISNVRMKIGNHIGTFTKLVDDLAPSHSILYQDFIKRLHEEIRGLTLKEFIDLTYDSPSDSRPITWLGTQGQLEMLFYELTKPIEDRGLLVNFLKDSADKKLFMSLFSDPHTTRIIWNECNPRSKQSTFISLLLLFKELQSHHLLPKSSQAAIGKFIQNNFSSPIGVVPNLKSRSSLNPRTLRIKEIVKLVATSKR